MRHEEDRLFAEEMARSQQRYEHALRRERLETCQAVQRESGAARTTSRRLAGESAQLRERSRRAREESATLREELRALRR
jgi:hypothetical protein